MVQKLSEGQTTAKKLDLVNDATTWLDAAECFLHGRGDQAVCPLCGAQPLLCNSACGFDRVGFMLLTCEACGKSVQFSRIRFPESMTK